MKFVHNLKHIEAFRPVLPIDTVANSASLMDVTGTGRKVQNSASKVPVWPLSV
jgi:hypothetical protein